MKIDFTPADFNVALATSVVVYGFSGDELLTLIAQKDGEPFHGAHILPTAIIRPDQAPENVVKSLLPHLTGRDDWPLDQLNSFANPYRNPSGRVVNIAYYCLVRLSDDLKASLEARGYRWLPVTKVPSMAYDHDEVMAYARERFKRRVKRRPVGFTLLPREFTLNEIQRLYECALGRKFDKRNFRRKVLKSQLLIETGNTVRSSAKAKRPSRLYMFDEKKYQTLTLKGYDIVYF
jgi:8-oxo-dGTP diphosphatase